MGAQDLQTGRYDQLVRRVGGLYGGGSKVVEVLPEVFPTLELENTTPELLTLSGWRTAWQSTERPAVIGQPSKSQLFNPANSGIIAAITQCSIVTDIDATLQAEFGSTQIGTGVAGLFRDSRFGTDRRTALQASSADNISTGGGLRIKTQAGVLIFLRDDNGIAVLTPGVGLTIGSQTDNLVLTITYFWRERPALESEINFP